MSRIAASTKKTYPWTTYLIINIFWLGLMTVNQSNGLIVPLLVQRFVGPGRQATAFGRIRLYSLMVALLVQAVAGMLSDRSTSRWGRRRPYILVGTLLNVACLVGIGLAPSYGLLFVAVLCSQAAGNIAHGAQQGLIPDLIPESRRGRFSGVKAVLEIPLPIIVVSFGIGPLVSRGDIWGGLLVAIGVLVTTMLITMLVREERVVEPPPFNWPALGRLLAMTGSFMAIILSGGAAVEWIGRLLEGVTSTTLLLIAMGLTGLLMMVLAVVLGVWVCVRISLGEKRTGSFTWWVINRLAFLVGANSFSTFAVYFFQARLGLEGEAAAGPTARLLMVVGILILICALLSGWLADRIGRKRLVGASGLLAALGTLILVLAPSLVMIYVGGAIIGGATGIFFTSNWALGTDIVPKAKSGQFLGISNLAGAGAGAIGGYIGGPLADYFTVRVPQGAGIGYLLVFGIYGVLFLISTLTLFFVHESHHHTHYS